MPAISKIAIKEQIFDALVQLHDFNLTKEQLEDFLSRSNFQMNKTAKKSNPDRKTSAYHCFLAENKEGTIQERRAQWKILNDDQESEGYLKYKGVADEINSSKNIPSKDDLKAAKVKKIKTEQDDLKKQIEQLKLENRKLKSDSDNDSESEPEQEPQQESEDESDPEQDPEPEPEVEPEPEPEEEPEPEPEEEPEPEPEVEVEVEPEPEKVEEKVEEKIEEDEEEDEEDEEEEIEKIKPKYTGKKPDSNLNNYKEWKKNLIGISVSENIKRADLVTYKEDDNFETTDYEEGCPWYNYIQDNMIV